MYPIVGRNLFSLNCSVVITAYNSSGYICNAIDSALNQKNVDVEVIIVDDFSDDVDCLKRIIEQKYAADSVFIMQPSSKGNANISRNIGVRKSKFDYVAFLDADDVWNEEHLFKAITHTINNSVDLTINKVDLVKDGNVLDVAQPTYEGDIAKYIFNNGIAVTSTIVGKKNTFLQCMFDEEQLKHQDWDFLIRYSNKFKIGQSSYVGLNYTLSECENMSSNSNPLATIRFLNNTLPLEYHKSMLLTQLHKMIDQRDKEAVINLKYQIKTNYQFDTKNLGVRALLYPRLFTVMGFNPLSIVFFNVIDSSLRASKKITKLIRIVF